MNKNKLLLRAITVGVIGLILAVTNPSFEKYEKQVKSKYPGVEYRYSGKKNYWIFTVYYTSVYSEWTNEYTMDYKHLGILGMLIEISKTKK